MPYTFECSSAIGSFSCPIFNHVCVISDALEFVKHETALKSVQQNHGKWISV